MTKKPSKQQGLSLFEIILAVMLVAGIVAVIMHIESGAKSSDNTTILAQEISLMLNKSLEKSQSDPSITVTVDINDIANYLGISQNFVSSLTDRGLKKYTLNISNGQKDSGQMETITYGNVANACDYLQVFIHNASSYSWLYDKQLSEDFKGQGTFRPDKSTPKNIDTVPIKPGETVRLQYNSGGDKIKQYLYFRSTSGNHVVGYYLKKAAGKTGDNKVDVDSNVQQGQNFTRHGKQDHNADCGANAFDTEESGEVGFILFDPVTKKTLIDTTLASIKQSKIISSKTYGLIDTALLKNSDTSATKPLDMIVNNSDITYTFEQTCADGALDHTDGNGIPAETPSECAYNDGDGSVTNY